MPMSAWLRSCRLGKKLGVLVDVADDLKGVNIAEPSSQKLNVPVWFADVPTTAFLSPVNFEVAELCPHNVPLENLLPILIVEASGLKWTRLTADIRFVPPLPEVVGLVTVVRIPPAILFFVPRSESKWAHAVEGMPANSSRM